MSDTYCSILHSSLSALRLSECQRNYGRVVAWIFTIAGALTPVLLLFYSAFYRARLDYRFEVTAILVTWLVLIAAPALLSVALVRTDAMQYQRATRAELSNRS